MQETFKMVWEGVLQTITKERLVGNHHLTQETFEMAWEGVLQTITKKEQAGYHLTLEIFMITKDNQVELR